MSRLIRARRPGATQLLARIVETPELVAAVGSLEPRALTKLIHHVGLEDAGEIVMLANIEQIERVFDEDLWQAERAGVEERFDAERFALWLEVMAECGEDRLADKLAELPRELVLLGLSRNILVIALDDLQQTMWGADEDDANQIDKALESALSEELDNYHVIARRHDGWDAVLGALLALDKNHHDVLVELLERCAAMSAERIEDSGGLLALLSADEMLESDVGGEREARRAEQGYVAPQAAAAFLALAAKTDVHALAQSRERDAVTLAYFRDLERRPAEASPRAAHDAAAADTAAAADKGSARLLHALREAGVVEQEPAAPLSLAAPEDGAELGGEELLRAALAELRARDPIAYSARFGELAYLANVLVSGYQRGTRRLPPAQAAKLALRVVARGVAQRLGSARLDALEATVRLLRREHADRLFRIGWPLHLDDEGQHPIA